MYLLACRNIFCPLDLRTAANDEKEQLEQTRTKNSMAVQ